MVIRELLEIGSSSSYGSVLSDLMEANARCDEASGHVEWMCKRLYKFRRTCICSIAFVKISLRKEDW